MYHADDIQIGIPPLPAWEWNLPTSVGMGPRTESSVLISIHSATNLPVQGLINPNSSKRSAKEHKDASKYGNWQTSMENYKLKFSMVWSKQSTAQTVWNSLLTGHCWHRGLMTSRLQCGRNEKILKAWTQVNGCSDGRLNSNSWVTAMTCWIWDGLEIAKASFRPEWTKGFSFGRWRRSTISKCWMNTQSMFRVSLSTPNSSISWALAVIEP